jgi:hypothetical protein
MRVFLIFLFVLFEFSNLFAFEQGTQPEVSLLQISSEGKKPLDWNYKILPMWEINLDGAYEFYWGLNLYMPAKSPIQNVQATNALIGFSKDAQTDSNGMIPLFIKMTSLSDNFIVSFKDNTKVQFEITLILEKFSFIEEGCEEYFLKISQNGKPSIKEKPFFLAYRCDKSVSGITLSVSVPQEASWISNSIFESKGKGKRWKTFEINSQVPSTGKNKIGELLLGFDSTENQFNIIISQLEGKRDIAKFRLAMSFINMNIKTNDKSDTLSKPAAFVSIELRPLTPEFSIGGQGIASLPSVTSRNYFTHTEALGYLGYTFELQKSWSIEPRIYGYMADGISQLLQFYYTLNIMAIGFEAKYKLSTYTKIGLESLQMNLPNQSINSLRLSIATLNKSKQTGWGLFFASQNLGSNLQTKSKGLAAQKVAGVFMDF